MRDWILLLTVLLCACGGRSHSEEDRVVHIDLTQQAKLGHTPPQAYVDKADRWMAETGKSLPGRPFPCAYTKMYDGVEVIESVETDKCVQMTQPQRWSGLWRNEFEGSQFCPRAAMRCSYESTPSRIWLHWDEREQPDGALYAVEFIGRRTRYPGMYGHLGGSEHEIIVDRMISIRQLEPGPKRPTPAEVEWWKRCEAAGRCGHVPVGEFDLSNE